MLKRLQTISIILLLGLSFFVGSSPVREVNSQGFIILSPSGNAGSIQYQMTQYPLPKGSAGPWSIAADRLGEIWVVEQVSNQLAVFNPSTKTFQEYQIPTPNSTADSVTTDSSGNVWFTGLSSNRLGELKNGSPHIIEYKIPNGTLSLAGQFQPLSCGPGNVVSDSHGNIWVLCLFSNQIDEFFPSNETFDRFTLPVFQSSPDELVFDHNGNFWFTAPNTDMIGRGILSELKNNTSDGIEETAPQNATYTFNFQHSTNLQGNTENIKSSLPTPAGIALSPDGNTLWISEHVDSSFDSYNIQSKSLDKYWTSQTNNAFGFPVSFPNGLTVDGSGNVWIAEHYGNKVAEFNPTSNSLTEYVVPCCSSSSAGVYTLTQGQNGTIWFVEILGNAIGELAPVSNPENGFKITTNSNQISIGRTGTVTIPITMQYSNFTSNNAENVSMSISGMSNTGSLINTTAQFDPPSFPLSGSTIVESNLTLSTRSLNSGVYYLTVSATLPKEDVIYSTILKVVGTSAPIYQFYLYAAGIVIVASIIVLGVLTFQRRKKGVRAKTTQRRRT